MLVRGPRSAGNRMIQENLAGGAGETDKQSLFDRVVILSS